MDGEESTDNPVDVNVKYEKEVRFVLGVAMVEKDGAKLGVGIPEFEYTEKTIIAQRAWEKKEVEACWYIAGQSNGGGWVKDCRGGKLYTEDENLVLVKGLGGETKEKLNKLGIRNLGELHDTLSNPTRRSNLISTVKGISATKAATWCTLLSDAPLCHGTCQPSNDYRSAPHPYKSRYPPVPNLPPGEK